MPLIVERRDVAHHNAGQCENATGGERLHDRRDQLSGGGEADGGIGLFGQTREIFARPGRAHVARELLVARAARHDQDAVGVVQGDG